MRSSPIQTLKQERLGGSSTGGLPRDRNETIVPEPQFIFRRNLIIDRDFEHVLEKTGLFDFDAIMCKQGVACVGGPPGRHTVRVAIPEASGATALYLTRYEESLASRVFKKGTTVRKRFSAIKEWRTILALRDCNLPVAVPIAVGLRRRPGLVTESFLVTLGPSQVTTVRSMMEETLYGQLDRNGLERKRRFLSSLALMLRHMHEKGFKYRDLYFSQILVNWGNAQNPVIALGNAFSVKKRSRKTHYWQTSDLASLNSAAPEAVFTRSDRLWFLQNYDSTLARDRAFVNVLRRKTKRIRNRNRLSTKSLVQLLNVRTK